MTTAFTITPVQWATQNKDRHKALLGVMQQFHACFSGLGHQVAFHLPYRKTDFYISMGIRPKNTTHDFLFYFGFFFDDVARWPVGYVQYAAKRAVERYKRFQQGTLGVEILSDERVLKCLTPEEVDPLA